MSMDTKKAENHSLVSASQAEIGPGSCFGGPSDALVASTSDDLPLGRAIRRQMTLGRGSLQRYRRRRRGRKPVWFSSTDEVKQLLAAKENTPALSESGVVKKSSLGHDKATRQTDAESVGTIFEEQDYGNKRD
jgi:hypothetical protein